MYTTASVQASNSDMPAYMGCADGLLRGVGMVESLGGSWWEIRHLVFLGGQLPRLDEDPRPALAQATGEVVGGELETVPPCHKTVGPYLGPCSGLFSELCHGHYSSGEGPW